jgi:membrane fusion protein (multidrug efflux system)
MTATQKKFKPQYGAILLLALLAACSKAPNDGGGNAMMNMPPPEVTVVEVQPANVPVSYEYIGQTVGSREVEVRARVTGNVERRMYEEGALVKAGQPLFQLDARPFALAVASAKAAVATAEADIARAEASAAQAQRERDRMVGLAEAHAISRKEADDATSAAQISNADTLASRARLEQAKAQLREAQLNVEYATITAPISGMAGRALRQEGSLVTAAGDSLLTTLVQLDPLYASFNVADGERQRIDQDVAAGSLEIPKGGFNVRLLQRDGSELSHGGKVNFVSSTISNQTGTLEMRAQIANPKGEIKSGLFVRVILEGATRPNALTVPQGAVLEGPTGKIVMVAENDKDGKLVSQPRPIEVGDWTNSGDQKLWVVRSGLKPGDKVIVDNLMKLRPGAPVSLGKAPVDAKPATTAAK